MFRLLRLAVESFCRCFCSRRDLLLENLALRQQLAIFKQRKQRPALVWLDKLFWSWHEEDVVQVEELSRPSHSRNGGALAPSRISQLVGLAFAARDRLRAEGHQQGTVRTDFPNRG